jgi:hypothetical protein
MGRAIAFAHKGDLDRAKADRAAALEIDPDVEAHFVEYGVEYPAAKDREFAR